MQRIQRHQSHRRGAIRVGDDSLMQFYIGRIDYSIVALKGVIRSNTLYELGTGREQKTQLVYQVSPTNQGDFVWRDDNRDGIFNDRPEGVGRNTLRADGQTTLNLAVTYQFAFGRTAPLPPGIGIFGGGGAMQVRTVDQGTARYRLQLFVQAQNLTNERNYLGYSGTLTSPFFGKPTAVGGMRKIDAGMNISF